MSNRVISGTHGKIWWNNALIMEASSFTATLKVNREDVNFLGQMATDSKLISYGGEWSINSYHIYSSAKELAEAIQRGEDVRFKLVGTLNDPDVNGSETVVLNNCWINDINLLNFEVGSVVNDEFSGGFTDFKFQ